VNDFPTGAAPGTGVPAVRGFLPAEWRAVGGLAGIYAARMLGLFLMLPVLALYARGLPGGSPVLAGLAVGAYGLTQALFQIPFGVLSDRFGRRLLVFVGLLLYAAGSVAGALAGTIGGVIAARMVQGMGAVSGPVTALVADLTRAEVRTRAMALIGIGIGASFIVSLVGAPLLDRAIGVPGIFAVMGVLAVLCLGLLYGVVPPPPRAAGALRVTGLGAVLNRTLMPHYLGILLLNAMLSATFVATPFALKDALGVAVADHWRTYLGVFLASVPATVPLVLWSERGGARAAMGASILLLAVSLAGLALGYRGYWTLAAALAGFFTAFNYLEARLPAGVSQAAAPEQRGAALSVFATAQFLGSALGAPLAGWLVAGPGREGAAFGVAAAISAGWWLSCLSRRR
jgi:MFS family permease